MAGQQWACTREQLVAALASIEIRPVRVPGRAASVVGAEDMADAILGQLPEVAAGRRGTCGAHLRQRIDTALQDSTDRCARCKACDAQVDAVMAALAAAGVS
jgi:hypothetical protein